MTQEEFHAMIEKYMGLASSMRKTHPFLRLGQCLYNLLYKSFPEACKKVSIDPFYKDENLNVFLECLEKELVAQKRPQTEAKWPCVRCSKQEYESIREQLFYLGYFKHTIYDWG